MHREDSIMTRPTWFGSAAALAATFVVVLMLAPRRAAAQQASDTLSESGVISGTMDIDFKTRTTPDTSGKFLEGSPAMGVQDKYTFNLTVARTTVFSGEIVRQPNIYTRTIRKREQGAALGFNIDLSVLNPSDPKQKKTVGKWVGTVPIDTATGAYDLGGGRAEERPLRIDVDAVGKAPAFKDFFEGKLIGKAEKKDNLAQYTYKRLVGKKTVEVVVKKSDPMKFAGIVLGKGPSDNYPRTIVDGRLDYDYETGNWYTDGIHFKYNFNGKDYTDIVTGSIKWVEDPDRETNGKGYYEFNLRFNEEKNKSSTGESAAFEKLSDEEAFFAVDDTIPCLTGRIEYVDVMVPGGDVPSRSKVVYNLNANKLTKQQIMNFFKLWMICAGPTNDE
jgi:hypothetical protein